MFIELQFGNFRSFRDLQKFTMEATPFRSNDSELEEDNVFNISSLRLLKSKAIYGGNASGKGNLAKAIDAFCVMVDKSVIQEGLAREIWDDRFQLLTNWDDQPVFFQYTFFYNNLIYRYGFQILEGKVSYEWLYSTARDEEIEYFMRIPGNLKINEIHLKISDSFTKQVSGTENELYREDSLFLTAGAPNGNKLLASLRDQIRSIRLIDGVNDNKAAQYAMNQLIHGPEERKAAIADLLNAADTGIEGLAIGESPAKGPNVLSTKANQSSVNKVEEKELSFFSLHLKYDENGVSKEKIVVPFGKWESQGTGKLLGVGSLILDVLSQGQTIVIDEFDARFHPNLSLKIVELFHDKKANPKNAQIIFVTHDTGLLRRAGLRRDQICLINKDRYGISSLTTLIEFKGVRKDASYEKEYLNGSYGAVPFLDRMDWVLKQKD
jgi:AAA15 family ATPase/GTPase